MSDDIEHNIGRTLAHTAERLPDDPGRWAGVQRIRRGRSRRRRAAVFGATSLAVAAAAVGSVVALQPSGHRATLTTGPTHAGEVRGSGYVVAEPGKPVRFCDPYAGTLVDGHEHPVPLNDVPFWSGPCTGVDVTGVELDRLTDRGMGNGIISGLATLTGVYDNGVLRVDAQQDWTPEIAPSAGTYDHPPCPAPAGGWYENGSTDNPDVRPAQAYQAAHPDAIVQFAISRPSRTQSLVLLLTEGDPTPVRAALASSYRRDQLCVARSRYTNADVTAVESDPVLSPTNRPVVVFSTGLFLDPNSNQVVFQVSTIIETPAMAAAIARYPSGLIRLDAWLRPATSS